MRTKMERACRTGVRMQSAKWFLVSRRGKGAASLGRARATTGPDHASKAVTVSVTSLRELRHGQLECPERGATELRATTVHGTGCLNRTGQRAKPLAPLRLAWRLLRARTSLGGSG